MMKAMWADTHILTPFYVYFRLQVDSEEERLPDEKYIDELSKTMPKGTDKTPEVLESALQGLPERWKNWIIRGIFTTIMICGFGFIIYLGPFALMITVSYCSLTRHI